MILADTSVWVDHHRGGDAQLVELLERNAVVMPPFIVGEIACGSLANRTLTLELLQQLPMAVVAEFDEISSERSIPDPSLTVLTGPGILLEPRFTSPS